MPTFSQLFGAHLHPGEICLPDGQVQNVHLDKPAGIMEIWVQFDAPVSRSVLKQAGVSWQMRCRCSAAICTPAMPRSSFRPNICRSWWMLCERRGCRPTALKEPPPK